MNQQVTLPPIKHVFQGLLNSKPTDPLHRKCPVLCYSAQHLLILPCRKAPSSSLFCGYGIRSGSSSILAAIVISWCALLSLSTCCFLLFLLYSIASSSSTTAARPHVVWRTSPNCVSLCRSTLSSPSCSLPTASSPCFCGCYHVGYMLSLFTLPAPILCTLCSSSLPPAPAASTRTLLSSPRKSTYHIRLPAYHALSYACKSTSISSTQWDANTILASFFVVVVDIHNSKHNSS